VSRVALQPRIAPEPAPAVPGSVDYRLRRRRLLADVEAGVVSRAEACDAHPDLLRAARNAAPPLGRRCPLCPDGDLRIVGYVFGPRMGSGGKCVLSDAELQRVARRNGSLMSYELGVCPGCCSSHLIRKYPLGAGWSGAGLRPLCRGGSSESFWHPPMHPDR